MPICERDLRPGGVHRSVWRKPDGAEMEIKGVFKDVTLPERVVSTESWGPEWPETLNTVTFAEKDGRTTVTIIILYPSKAARDNALKTGMKEGMDHGFERLEEYLRAIA